MPKVKKASLCKEDREQKAECDLKELKRKRGLLQALVDKHKSSLDPKDAEFDPRRATLEFQALCTRKHGHADDWLTRPRSAGMKHWEDLQKKFLIERNESLLKKFKDDGALMKKLDAGKGNATHHYESFMDAMWMHSQWMCDEAYRPEGVPRPGMMQRTVTYENDEHGRLVLGSTAAYPAGTECPDPDAGSEESLMRAWAIANEARADGAPM